MELAYQITVQCIFIELRFIFWQHHRQQNIFWGCVKIIFWLLWKRWDLDHDRGRNHPVLEIMTFEEPQLWQDPFMAGPGQSGHLSASIIQESRSLQYLQWHRDQSQASGGTQSLSLIVTWENCENRKYSDVGPNYLNYSNYGKVRTK